MVGVAAGSSARSRHGDRNRHHHPCQSGSPPAADSETARAVNELATAHQGAESRLADRLAASEAETRLERDSLLAVLAGLEVPVGLVDEHGRIMLVNPSARTVLGPGRHIAAGRSIFSVFDAGDFAPLLAQALSG